MNKVVEEQKKQQPNSTEPSWSELFKEAMRNQKIEEEKIEQQTHILIQKEESNAYGERFYVRILE